MDVLKKTIAFLMSTVIILSSSQVAFADSGYDITAPELCRFKILDSENISTKGTMNIDMDLVEDGSGIEKIEISFRSTTAHQYAYLRYDAGSNGNKLLFTGKNRVSFKLGTQSASFIEGEYEINSIAIYDVAENKYYCMVEPDNDVFVTKTIQVRDSEIEDTTGPVLKSVKIQNSDNIVYGENLSGFIDIEEVSGLKSFELQYQNEEMQEITIYGIPSKSLRTGQHQTQLYFEGTQELMDGDYYLTVVKAEDILGNIYLEESNEWDEDLFSGQITVCNVQNSIGIEELYILESDVKTPNVINVVVKWNPGEEGIDALSIGIVNEKGNKKSLYWETDTPIKEKTALIKIPLNTYLEDGDYRIEQVTAYSKEFKKKYSDATLSRIVKDNHNIAIKSQYDIVYYGSTANVAGVLKAIDEMQDGTVAIIQYSVQHIANKSIFEAIAGKDITLVFEGEDIQWVFNGKDIDPNKCKSIDLNVGVSMVSGPKYGYADDKHVLMLKFAENGILPGKATIRFSNEYIKVRYGYKSNMVLSYYDATPEVLADKISCSEDGYAEIEITHNSTHILSDHKPRLTAPTGFAVKGENSRKVAMTWGKVYGALGYYIYRSDTKDGTYKRIKVINGNAFNSFKEYDTTVTPGKKYYYRVCAFGKNVNAIYTSKQSARPLPLKAQMTAKKKSSKIKLSLKTSDGVKNFRIYTSLDGKKYKLVKTLKNKKKYTLKKPKKAKKLYIKVRAYVTYNGKKYYGAYSKAKKIK